MSRIRDVFRSALAARSPSPEEARDDLDKILSRARRRVRIGWVALAAAAALGVSVAVVMTRGRPDRSETIARAPDRTIRIYVRRADEPESDAISVTLDAQGDL